MPDWRASAGGCSYTFHAAYVPGLAVACVAALIGLAGLRMAFARWRGRQPAPPAFLGAGLSTLAIVTALLSTGCATVKLDDAFRANVLFRPLVLTCACAFAAGLVMLILGILQLVFYRRMPARTLLPWGLGSLLASLAVLVLAVGQVVDLGNSYLPVIDVPATIGFHAGFARHVRPQLFRRTEPGGRIPLDDPGWIPEDVVFEASTPGVVERRATARQGSFTVSTNVKAKAHGDAGNPWLSLRVGNEWRYTLTTTTQADGTRYLLVFTGSTSANVKTSEVVVTIEPAPARDGWRELTLVVKSGTGDSLGQHVLRPIDDETYFYDRASLSGVEPPDEAEPTDPKCALHVLLDVDPGSGAERGCRMANLGVGRCQRGGALEDVLPPAVVVKDGGPKKPPGHASPKAPPSVLARVPTQYALAGPSHLSTHWENRGGAESWIVGFLTAGIVIPTGTSGGEEYMLMKTTPGAGR